MAKKDDPQNLGGEVGPPQHRFLLVLFSGPLDILPWPGKDHARLTLSNEAVGNIVHHIFCLVHLRCQRRLMKKT